MFGERANTIFNNKIKNITVGHVLFIMFIYFSLWLTAFVFILLLLLFECVFPQVTLGRGLVVLGLGGSLVSRGAGVVGGV